MRTLDAPGRRPVYSPLFVKALVAWNTESNSLRSWLSSPAAPAMMASAKLATAAEITCPSEYGSRRTRTAMADLTRSE